MDEVEDDLFSDDDETIDMATQQQQQEQPQQQQQEESKPGLYLTSFIAPVNQIHVHTSKCNHCASWEIIWDTVDLV